MADDFDRESFSDALRDLCSIERFVIVTLTEIAGEYKAHAKEIVTLIEDRIRTVSDPMSKLAAWYLMDSILKSLGQPFVDLVGTILATTFVDTLRKSDEGFQHKYFKLAATWRDGVFSSGTMYALCKAVSADSVLSSKWDREYVESMIEPGKRPIPPKYARPTSNTKQSAPVPSRTSVGSTSQPAAVEVARAPQRSKLLEDLMQSLSTVDSFTFSRKLDELRRVTTMEVKDPAGLARELNILEQIKLMFAQQNAPVVPQPVATGWGIEQPAPFQLVKSGKVEGSTLHPKFLELQKRRRPLEKKTVSTVSAAPTKPLARNWYPVPSSRWMDVFFSNEGKLEKWSTTRESVPVSFLSSPVGSKASASVNVLDLLIDQKQIETDIVTTNEGDVCQCEMCGEEFQVVFDDEADVFSNAVRPTGASLPGRGQVYHADCYMVLLKQDEGRCAELVGGGGVGAKRAGGGFFGVEGDGGSDSGVKRRRT